MGAFGPDDTRQLRELFAAMTEPVEIHLLTDDLELRLLYDELADLAGDKLVLDKIADDARAAELEIDYSPGALLKSSRAKGKLFFYGVPGGYEMATLISAITDLGGADADALVSPQAQEALTNLASDVHIQVFSTPT